MVIAERAVVHIPEKLFFKIGEVCDILGVQAHVLRYWESEFPMLAPQKNRAGQRTYRKRDVEMALRIKELLYEDQYTIAGAKKRLSNDMRGASKLKVVTPEMAAAAASAPAPSPLPAPVMPASAPRENIPAERAAQSLAELGQVAATMSASGSLSETQLGAMRHLKSQLRDLLSLLETDDSSAALPRK